VRATWSAIAECFKALLDLGEQGMVTPAAFQAMVRAIAVASTQQFWSLHTARDFAGQAGLRLESAVGADGVVTSSLHVHAPDGSSLVADYFSSRVAWSAASRAVAELQPPAAAAVVGGAHALAMGAVVGAPPAAGEGAVPAVGAAHPKDFMPGDRVGAVRTLDTDFGAALCILTTTFHGVRKAVSLPKDFARANSTAATSSVRGMKWTHDSVVSVLRTGVKLAAAQDSRVMMSIARARAANLVERWPKSRNDGAIPDEVLLEIAGGRLPSAAAIGGGVPVSESLESVRCLKALLNLVQECTVPEDPIAVHLDRLITDFETRVTLFRSVAATSEAVAIAHWWAAYDAVVRNVHVALTEEAVRAARTAQGHAAGLDDDGLRSSAVEAFHRSADRRLDMVREIESLLARAAQDAGHAAGGGGGSGAASTGPPRSAGGHTAAQVQPGAGPALSTLSPMVSPFASLHIPQAASPAPALSAGVLCRNWLNGRCNFGDACKYVHIPRDSFEQPSGGPSANRKRPHTGGGGGAQAQNKRFVTAPGPRPAAPATSNSGAGGAAPAVTPASLSHNAGAMLWLPSGVERHAHTPLGSPVSIPPSTHGGLTSLAVVVATTTTSAAAPRTVGLSASCVVPLNVGVAASSSWLSPAQLVTRITTRAAVAASQPEAGSVPNSAAAPVSVGEFNHASWWEARPAACYLCRASLREAWRPQPAVIRVNCGTCGARVCVRSRLASAVGAAAGAVDLQWGGFTVHEVAMTSAAANTDPRVTRDVVVSWCGIQPLWRLPATVARRVRAFAIERCDVRSEAGIGDVLAVFCAWATGRDGTPTGPSASAAAARWGGTARAVTPRVPLQDLRASIARAAPPGGSRVDAASRHGGGETARAVEPRVPLPESPVLTARAPLHERSRVDSDSGGRETARAGTPRVSSQTSPASAARAPCAQQARADAAIDTVERLDASALTSPARTVWLARYGATHVTQYAQAWAAWAVDASASVSCPHPIGDEHAQFRVTDVGSLRAAMRKSEMAAPVVSGGVSGAGAAAGAGGGPVHVPLASRTQGPRDPPTASSLLDDLVHAFWEAASLTDPADQAFDAPQVWPARPWSPLPEWLAPVSSDEGAWAVAAANDRLRGTAFAELHPGVPVWHSTRSRESGPAPWDRLLAAQQVFQDHPHGPWLALMLATGVPLLDHSAPRHAGAAANHLRGDAALKAARVWLHEEAASGHVVRLSRAQAAGLPALLVSPILAVPKLDGGVSRFRLCANLAAPVGPWHEDVLGATTVAVGAQPAASVNSSMMFDPLYPCDLASLEWAITSIAHLRRTLPEGTVVLGSRVDLASFFRQVRVAARDHWRVAHVFDDSVWLHTRLSFGGASSPLYACALSNAVADTVGHGVETARHSCFVDDFVALGDAAGVDAVLGELRARFATLSLRENESKFVRPAQQLTILGVDFDLEAGTVDVSRKRRAKLIDIINGALALVDRVRGGDGSVGHRLGSMLAQIGGHLAFLTPLFPLSPLITSQVWAAAAILGDAAPTTTPHWRALRWALEVWADVLAPPSFAATANDRDIGASTPWLAVARPRVSLDGTYAEVHTDSCNDGFGAVLWPDGVFFAEKWTLDEASMWTSTVLEAWAATLACMMFAPRCVARGVRVLLLRSDNIATCCAVSAARCDDARLFKPVAWMCVLQWFHGLRVLPLHVPGLANQIPDALSRSPADPPALVGMTRCSLPSAIRELPKHAWDEWPWSRSSIQLVEVPGPTLPSGDGGVVSGPRPLGRAMRSTPVSITTPTWFGPAL
jgi:hypothetical protein